MLSLKFGWNWENCGSSIKSSLLKILHIRNFAKCTELPRLNSRYSTWKVLYLSQHIGPQVPNLLPFRSTISHFQDITHFRMPYFKCHKSFDLLVDRQKSHNLYSFMTIILTIKFGWNLMKIGRGIEFWKLEIFQNLDQNLGLKGKYLVYMEYFWLLDVQLQFGVTLCISDFWLACISETASRRAKRTTIWASGVSIWPM